MAHNLVSLLEGGAAEALAIRELRLMTKDGVDVRLIADILSKAHTVMRRLGLDPSDTTAEEVYHALVSAVATEQFLSLLEDTDYVLVELDGRVISFNPVDVIDNYHYQLPIDERRTSAAKKGLGWEITRRYKDNPAASKQRVEQAAERAGWPESEPQFCKIIFGKPSILTVGDITTEALITLGKNSVELIDNKTSRKLAIGLGSKVLAETSEVIDAVGGAANASVAFSKLGVQPSLISWVGGDAVGRLTIDRLRKFGVDMSGVSVEKSRRSNYHYVMRSGAERTIIASYEKFDYRWRQPACQPDWVYLSMISSDSWELHRTLMEFLDENKSVKLAFQPGPAHIAWGKKKLAKILKRTEVIIMNTEEASLLAEVDIAKGVPAIMASLHETGVHKVIVTDGPRGAYASDGEAVYEVPSYPDISRPFDRSGAGDAFAATVVAMLARGESLEDALLLAPINSMNVVQHLGPQAGLLSDKELSEMAKNAPEGYSLNKL